MLFFKRSLKKKILATDGYVEEPQETRIILADRLGSNVEHDYICCVFLFTEQIHSSPFVPFRGQTSGQKKGEITMGYKTDIEIAQECEMKPITEIAAKAGIDDKYLEQYGKYKAKIDYNLLKESDKKDGKLILVTAINRHRPVKERLQQL